MLETRIGILTFDSIDAHRFNHIVGESERHSFRNLECLALSHQYRLIVTPGQRTDLVEQTVQIDMDSITGQGVKEDILPMPITQSIISPNLPLC
jgi:hypothetical protein